MNSTGVEKKKRFSKKRWTDDVIVDLLQYSIDENPFRRGLGDKWTVISASIGKTLDPSPCPKKCRQKIDELLNKGVPVNPEAETLISKLRELRDGENSQQPKKAQSRPKERPQKIDGDGPLQTSAGKVDCLITSLQCALEAIEEERRGREEIQTQQKKLLALLNKVLDKLSK
eukprot:CAMPEP_0198234314 /NCGR_PEP_ID=MMETSP1446-20131203/362_1 /TAXON_ID=1461542 ORGANISM="Unidentified sp, Strain CCMP2111" /NCGR_SAMPLE_ID=MMETSP1446 /ASSEMBLY_ACC=CAM_ASM_001112 /LENGTH=171 /DNA_ID=CAMNT_0043915075 /DNA_START=154 /DNA_END=669 /DNA_ORIENTATION=-